MNALHSGISGALAPINRAMNTVFRIPWLHGGIKRSKSKLVLNSLQITLEDVPKELICDKCQMVMSNPRQMSGCGRSVCGKSCIGPTQQQCPFCRKSSCKPFPNPYFVNKISNLVVKCPNYYTDQNSPKKQCRWVGKVNDVRRHLNTCNFKMVTCDMCGKEVVKKYLAAHRLDSCPNQKQCCMYCGAEGPAHEIDNHETYKCPKRRVQCPNNCQLFSIPHDLIEEHLSECPMQLVSCSKCGVQILRNEQETHTHQHHSLASSESSRASSVSNHSSEMHSSWLLLSETPHFMSKRFIIDNYKRFVVVNDSESVKEVFQRIVISYLSICTIFLLALLRNQIHVADSEEDHNIPSLLLWSTFTSVSVINLLMGSWTGCEFASVREWVVVFTVAQLLYLTCFYTGNVFYMITGSLLGSSLITLLFIKHRKRYPQQYGLTFYLITHLMETMLVLSVIRCYYITVVPLAKVIVLVLLFDLYMFVLQKREFMLQTWYKTPGIIKTVCLVAVYLLMLTLITSCSLYIISCYFLYGTFTFINVTMVTAWPFLYVYCLSKEEVQNMLGRMGQKIYNADLYCFWGRVFITTLFNYAIISHLIIPMIQKTSDYFTGSLLVSVLVVYTFLVQVGIKSETGLRDILQRLPTTNTETWQSPPVMKIAKKCCLVLQVHIEETKINKHILQPNETSTALNVHIKLQSSWYKGDDGEDMMGRYSVAVSVVNSEWTSSNAVLNISSDMAQSRRILKTCCLTLNDWHNLVTENSLALQVKVTHI